MRVCSYISDANVSSYGVIRDGRVHDAGESLRDTFPDLRAAIAAQALGEVEKASSSGQAWDIGQVRMLPPIPNPDKILCIGLNYMTHIRETGRDKPAKPSVFTRYPSSVIGHGAALERPKASDWFDYEGELAVIIGRSGRDVAESDALAHVAGFTCFNDGSVRDYQRHTSQFWAGKNFVSSGSMGPWIVTSDELNDPEAQTMQTRLNGEVVQSTSISDLAFTIPQLIAYLSVVTELLPGDVIATGTPSGVGLFREPKLFMKPGDRVEVDISGIGVLANPVADQA